VLVDVTDVFLKTPNGLTSNLYIHTFLNQPDAGIPPYIFGFRVLSKPHYQRVETYILLLFVDIHLTPLCNNIYIFFKKIIPIYIYIRIQTCQKLGVNTGDYIKGIAMMD